MSLNNDFAKSYFKTDQHGRRMFYPYGNFGKAYLLPEGEHESLLVNFIRTFLIVTGICSTASGIFLGVVFTFVREENCIIKILGDGGSMVKGLYLQLIK